MFGKDKEKEETWKRKEGSGSVLKGGVKEEENEKAKRVDE